MLSILDVRRRLELLGVGSCNHPLRPEPAEKEAKSPSVLPHLPTPIHHRHPRLSRLPSAAPRRDTTRRSLAASPPLPLVHGTLT
ncbi:hypothetical protein EE612_011850 [Oryza sativa]|nr:hypothetical protein EE612_011850 [Oryza sativa]